MCENLAGRLNEWVPLTFAGAFSFSESLESSLLLDAALVALAGTALTAEMKTKHEETSDGRESFSFFLQYLQPFCSAVLHLHRRCSTLHCWSFLLRFLPSWQPDRLAQSEAVSVFWRQVTFTGQLRSIQLIYEALTKLCLVIYDCHKRIRASFLPHLCYVWIKWQMDDMEALSENRRWQWNSRIRRSLQLTALPDRVVFSPIRRFWFRFCRQKLL